MSDRLVPGEIKTGSGPVALNRDRDRTTLSVANVGDRPVQVGSHLHFVEANAALRFDREAAIGMRLDIPAGTAVRFEPGDEQPVDLVAIGGERYVQGINGLTAGSLSDRDRILERLCERGFLEAER